MRPSPLPSKSEEADSFLARSKVHHQGVRESGVGAVDKVGRASSSSSDAVHGANTLSTDEEVRDSVVVEVARRHDRAAEVVDDIG